MTPLVEENTPQGFKTSCVKKAPVTGDGRIQEKQCAGMHTRSRFQWNHKKYFKPCQEIFPVLSIPVAKGEDMSDSCSNCGRYKTDKNSQTCGCCDEHEKNFFKKAFGPLGTLARSRGTYKNKKSSDFEQRFVKTAISLNGLKK